MPTVNVPGGFTASLVNWLLANFPKQRRLKEGAEEAGLINRLDNDTSGIVVAARKDEAFEALKNTWRVKEVFKEYRALVLGQTKGEGRITDLIGHHPSKANKMIVVTDANEAKKLNARYAETEYRLLEWFLDYSYLSIRIITGVRHQIRCHLASIGHPIAGDKLYMRTKHESRDWLDLSRHFLHASKVGFIHPSTKKEVEYESPIPADLTEALTKLKA